MSAHPCGCDPELDAFYPWHCRDYPNCAWGRCQNFGPIKPVLIYGSAPGAENTPAFKAVKKLLQDSIDALPDPLELAERAAELLLGKWEGMVPVRDVPMPMPREMTLNDYQRSLHTYKDRHQECHALGLSGELAEVFVELSAMRDAAIAAGSIADMVKKATAHGVPLDPAKLKKELGDALWYITAVASDNALTLEDIAKANVAKLQERYPNGFVKGGGVRGPEGSVMNESQVAVLRATEPSVNLRTGPASSVSFSCGCSETNIDGVRTRTYCPNGECRRLAR